MICLRCGYCCKKYLVAVIDDPEKGFVEGNVIVNEGTGEPCKHLIGDKPGDYSCVVHDRDWYPETPCFDHTQVESKNTLCRMGEYILDKLSCTI